MSANPNANSFNRIIPSGNTNILTYDDIKTRTFDSIRIGTYCGKNLKSFNNIFIGKEAGLNSFEVENSILLGSTAGANLINGNKNIIIGYNYCGDTTSNLINIGDNYTSSTSTTIGYYNENIGISNIIVGYYSSNLGNNLYTIGNNLIIKSSSVFYHNGLIDPTLKNLTYSIDNYSFIYSNIYNSIDNDNFFIKTSNIIIQKKNLITDFIIPVLRKTNSFIFQGLSIPILNDTSIYKEIFQLNLTNFNYTSNILPSESYNLINNNHSIIIPNSIIRRIAPPQLNIITKIIYFDPFDGIILNTNEYVIKYLVTTPPVYGKFKTNLVINPNIDRNNLIYIANNNNFNIISDTCGLTPLLFINNNNEIIAGPEVQFTFNRNFENLQLNQDNPINLNYSKEINFKSSLIIIDVISFDFIQLKTKIIDNLIIDSSLNTSNIFINFTENPLNGFISDLNRNPVSSVNYHNLNQVIYQNYNNKTNEDSFKFYYSYGYYFANKNEITVDLNIINENKIVFKDQFLYDGLTLKNNIISSTIPTYIINYSSSSNITPINDYYLTHKQKFDNNSNLKVLDLRLAMMNSNKLLFDNPIFYNYFNSISFTIHSKIIISSNQIFNYPNDYQYLRYDINEGLINKDTTISF